MPTPSPRQGIPLPIGTDRDTRANWNAALSQVDAVSVSKIAEVYFGVAGPTATFSAINQNFRHLFIEGLVRSSAGFLAETLQLQFNGDSGAHYDYVYQTFYPSTINQAQSQTSAIVGNMPAVSASANRFAHVRIEIPFYSQALTHKPASFHGADPVQTGPGDFDAFVGGLVWKATPAAITQIDLFGSANFVIGSLFSLYGMP